jgi:hypothetical protein
MGAELAVHGYDHVDFRSLSKAEAREQLVRAAQAYREAGVGFAGFRCPYLGYTDDVLDAIPRDLFDYSSNRAVWWDVVPTEASAEATAIFEGLRRFYGAQSSDLVVATPRLTGDLVEIPPSLPDDLQLLDGLRLDEAGLTRAWTEILHRSHRRGELFVLLFHPESWEQCTVACESVLKEARLLAPAVWVTQLRDVGRWWRQRAGFGLDVAAGGAGFHVRFECSKRATILVRNLDTGTAVHRWDDAYQVLEDRTLHLAGDQLPFVGLPAGAPAATIAFLKEQGYVVEAGGRRAARSTWMTLPCRGWRARSSSSSTSSCRRRRW